MELYSDRKQKITEVQNILGSSKGAWENNVVARTSYTGFIHGPPRQHSPIKIATYTKGSWEDFIRRSDFIVEGGKKLPPHKEDHFVVGMGTVAQLGEGDLFNLRGLKRINIVQKESHVFDAQRKQFTTFKMSQPQKDLWNKRFRSDYSKYHHSEYLCPSQSLASQEQQDVISQNSSQKNSLLQFESNQSSSKSKKSLNSYLVVHKPEKSYKNLSEAKKRNNQAGKSQTNSSQKFEQQKHLLSIGKEQFEVKFQSSNKDKVERQNGSPIKQVMKEEPRKDSQMQIEEEGKHQIQSQRESIQNQRESIQRVKSYSVFRDFSSLSNAGSSIQVSRCLSPTTDSRSRANDLGDFDRKIKKRRPLPTSEIQKSFQEYKKFFDSVYFG